MPRNATPTEGATPDFMRFSPPTLHLPGGPLPVLLSVPHAGRDYPTGLLELSIHGLEALQPLEDPLVDLLLAPAIAAGAGAVIARAPRAAADCNRSEADIDPTVVAVAHATPVSARARSGLGVIPGRTASHGPLWRGPLSSESFARRIDEVHRPFHDAIASGLTSLVGRFGCALLIDCHSMPPLPGGPSIVVGDRHGTSAAHWVRNQAVREIAAAGFRPAVNAPFAGGHVIERHGQPIGGVHAIQIEIDRRLYLAAGARTLAPASERIASLIARLSVRLGSTLLDRPLPVAAE